MLMLYQNYDFKKTFPKMDTSNFTILQTIPYPLRNKLLVVKTEEITMNQSCSKCNSEMQEYKTNIIISKSLFKQKHASAIVCEDCGCIEFFMQ